MEIYPAIDLMDGGCVRLSGGDFTARTNYDVDPHAVARRYAEAGATWLHLVDLDGARDPGKRQTEIIGALIKGAGLKVQIGGGVRTLNDVETLLGLGVERVVVGSLAVNNEPETTAIFEKFGPERIVLALDVHGDFAGGYFVATAGWRETSDLTIEAMLDRYQGLVSHILCTDISKDGKLSGTNDALYRYLCDIAPDVAFQASGGVATLDDLDAVREAGVAGVVIGKALYENRFTLGDALRRAA